MKTKKSITLEQAIAELNKKYPNDIKKTLDEQEKVRQAKQVKPMSVKELEDKAESEALEVSVPLNPVKDAMEAKKAEPKEKKPSVLLERIAFLTPLIESGQHTQAELLDKTMEKFPTLTKSTVQTFLTDSKNAKYNKFPKLIVLNDEGKLAFKE